MSIISLDVVESTGEKMYQHPLGIFPYDLQYVMPPIYYRKLEVIDFKGYHQPKDVGEFIQALSQYRAMWNNLIKPISKKVM
jgi:hypothetical protein